MRDTIQPPELELGELPPTVGDDSNRDLPEREPWWSLPLVLLALVVVVGVIAAMWWRSTSLGRTEYERYYPLATGVTRNYRVTHPHGSATYQSENIEQQHGSNVLSQLSGPTLLQLQQRGVTARNARVAWSTVTDFTTSGAITRTTTILLIEPGGVSALAIGDLPFDPPLPLLTAELAPGAATVVTGTGGSSDPYTATLAVEVQEAVEVPLGRLEDCWRVRLRIQLSSYYDGDSLNWYCAGVGLARQETRDNITPGPQLYELIGTSTPDLLSYAEVPAPLPPPEASSASTGPPAELGESLETVWSYQERSSNSGITTSPLPAGDLLIYGTRTGGLVALDRGEHVLEWRFQTGGPIYGRPVVSDGEVYVGSADRKLYALDMVSGVFRWAFATRDAISAGAAMADGVVYVGSEDRNVYALDAATGRERWQYTTGGSVVATPRVVDGVVYVGSDDGALYALDAASGQVRWIYPAGDAITARAVVTDGVVYVGAYDQTLYALDAAPDGAQGEELWSYNAESNIVNEPLLHGDTIFLALEEEVRALDARTGVERWRYVEPIGVHGSPLVVHDRLLVNRGNAVLLLDAHSGTLRATVPTGEPRSYPALSAAGAEVYVAHWDGFLRVLGPGTTLPWQSEPVWEATALHVQLSEVLDGFGSPPAAEGDRLVYVTVGGRLYALATADGRYETLGALEDIGVVYTPPALADETLYVVDLDGTLVSFDTRQRRERWRVETGGQALNAPVVVAGRVLIAVGGPTTVAAYAFDTRDGSLLWQQSADTPFGLASSSLLDDGRFYFTADAVYALDSATGDLVWRSSDGAAPMQLAMGTDLLYGIGSAPDGGWTLLAWDLQTGENRLTSPLDLPTFPSLLGSLASGGERVVLLLNDGTTLGFDARSGAELWRQPALSAPRGVPVLYKDTLLLVTKHNHLIARSLDDGRLVGDFALRGGTAEQDFSAMAPLLVDRRLYVALSDTALALVLKEAP